MAEERAEEAEERCETLEFQLAATQARLAEALRALERLSIGNINSNQNPFGSPLQPSALNLSLVEPNSQAVEFTHPTVTGQQPGSLPPVFAEDEDFITALFNDATGQVSRGRARSTTVTHDIPYNRVVQANDCVARHYLPPHLVAWRQA